MFFLPMSTNYEQISLMIGMIYNLLLYIYPCRDISVLASCYVFSKIDNHLFGNMAHWCCAGEEINCMNCIAAMNNYKWNLLVHDKIIVNLELNYKFKSNDSYVGCSTDYQHHVNYIIFLWYFNFLIYMHLIIGVKLWYFKYNAQIGPYYGFISLVLKFKQFIRMVTHDLYYTDGP